jgi:hypothetical protein
MKAGRFILVLGLVTFTVGNAIALPVRLALDQQSRALRSAVLLAVGVVTITLLVRFTTSTGRLLIAVLAGSPLFAAAGVLAVVFSSHDPVIERRR